MKCDSLIFKMLALSKKPNDFEIINDIVSTIDTMFNYNSDTNSIKLGRLIINDCDNDMMRDVNVVLDYFNTFDNFLLNGNVPKKGMTYTVEIKKSALSKMAPETLTAIMIHDILHNVMSDCVRSRFIAAYTDAMNNTLSSDMLTIYSNTIRSEVLYMIFLDICLRPFEITTVGYDYIGCDEVLVSMGLGEIYDEYVKKTFSAPYIKDCQYERIIEQSRRDVNIARRVLQACKNGSIRQLYVEYQRYSPLLFVKYMMNRSNSGKFNIGGKEFVACGLTDFSTNSNNDLEYNPMLESAIILESMIKPKSHVNIRFDIDKIIVSAKYIDTEAQRAAVLYDIRCMQLKLVGMRSDVDKKISRHPEDKSLRDDKAMIDSYYNELDNLRNTVANSELKPVKYGIFVKYPAGYDF